MNTGIFGEGFPYSNFHDLNMDWIIKIAKDFLDQYTHIQEIIEQGKDDIETLTESGITQIGDLTATSLQDLEDKKDYLEALLQQWYDTHSEDIADQLADALADLNEWYTLHQNYLDQTLADKISAFNTAADAKAATTIASIPDDYTALSNKVTEAIGEFNATEQYKYNNLIPAFELGDINPITGDPDPSSTNLRTSDFIKIKPENTYVLNIAGNAIGVLSGIVFFYRDNKQLISYSNQFSYTPFTTPANAYYCKFVLPTIYGTTYNNDVVFSEENAIHKNAEFINMLSHYLADNLLGSLEIGDISGTGEPISGNTTLRTTDFIEVSENDKYILFIDSLANGPSGFIYYYGANRAFISLAPVQNKTAITIPANAYYCKFVFSASYGTTNLEDIYFAHFGGSTKTIQHLFEYIPFLGTRALRYSYEVGDIDASWGDDTPGSTTLRTANMMPVHAGSNYMVLSASPVNPMGFLYYYDETKTYLGFRQIPNTRNFEAIANAKYMRVVLASQYGTTFNHDVIFIEKYGGAYNPYENKLPIIVAKDGSGDFTSLTEACRTAESGQTIFVRHGIYENEEVEAMTKTLYIIGEDAQTTIIKNQTGAYARPPIEIGAGLLKNLTIFEDSVATDGTGAYAVHIDTDYSENKDFTIENCILKSKAQSAIGFGMRGGCTFTFKNSEFYSETGYGIFANDALPEQPMGHMTLKIIGCSIYSNTHQHEPMLISSWRGEDNRTDCIFQHNVVTNIDNNPVCWFFNQTDPRAGEATDVGNLHGLIGWYNSVLSYGNNYDELNYHAQNN